MKRLLNSFNPQRISLRKEEIQCLPSKINWIFKHCDQELKKIMIDNAVFIEPPAANDQKPILTFYGHIPAHLNKAIRQVNKLVNNLELIFR